LQRLSHAAVFSKCGKIIRFSQFKPAKIATPQCYPHPMPGSLHRKDAKAFRN
jgi:hypothetical protein